LPKRSVGGSLGEDGSTAQWLEEKSNIRHQTSDITGQTSRLRQGYGAAGRFRVSDFRVQGSGFNFSVSVNLAIGVNRRYLSDLTIQRFSVFIFSSQLLNFFFQLNTLCNWCRVEREARNAEMEAGRWEIGFRDQISVFPLFSFSAFQRVPPS
jgi:hypothetical protein